MHKSAKYQHLSTSNRAIAAFDFLAENDVVSAAAVLLSGPESTTGNALIVDLANAALGDLLAEAPARMFENSARAAALLDEMTIALSEDAGTPRASSSGYHFRLASQHGDAFAKASRTRHANVYAVMRAIVDHHAALLRGEAERERTQSALAALIGETFGAASTEARMIQAQSFGEKAECFRARAEKLRAVTRHASSNADLSPEIALAAMVILPAIPAPVEANILPLRERA